MGTYNAETSTLTQYKLLTVFLSGTVGEVVLGVELINLIVNIYERTTEVGAWPTLTLDSVVTCT